MRVTLIEIRRLVSRALDETLAGRKKKNCSRGAPYHDANGKFSSKGDAKSKSVPNPDGKADCFSGQLAQSPSRWTKTRCGRDSTSPTVSPDDSAGKAKWKCKDGTVAEQFDQSTQDLAGLLERFPETPLILGELADLFPGLNEGEGGSSMFKSVLRRINAAALASQGKLFDDRQ